LVLAAGHQQAVSLAKARRNARLTHDCPLLFLGVHSSWGIHAVRINQPWKRKSTGTWYVCLNGRQRCLGADKKQAHEEFRRLTQSGVTINYTVRQIVQAYRAWAQQHHAETTLRRRQPVLDSFTTAMRATLRADALRACHVQDWLDSIQYRAAVKGGKRGVRTNTEKRLGPSTVGEYISLIPTSLAE
jgi:hypothetical protein